jgi:hypothetical protein
MRRVWLDLFLLMVVSASAMAQRPTTANLWVDTNGGTCTRQATPGAYVDAQACSSMQVALTAAQAGDVVIIKNGTYGAQSLTSSAKTSAVSFYAETASTCEGQPASASTCTGSVQLNCGATATANCDALTITVDHVHVYGVVSAGSGETRGGLDIETYLTSTTDILVNGFAGKNFYAGSSGTTIEYGEFGGFNACNGYNGSGCNAGSDCAIEDAGRFWGDPAPINDKLLHNAIHDANAPPDGVCGGGSGIPHVDLLQVYQSTGTASNIVIDGNLFYNPGGDSNMQWGGGGLSNITIQNNYFDSPACCNSIAFGQASPCNGLVYRNNVQNNGYDPINNGTCSGSVDISNNIFTNQMLGCLVAGGTVTGGNNIFPSGSGICGSNVKTCTVKWLNGAPSAANGYDMRLDPTDTCALNAGNASDYAPMDFYGTARPQGSAPDIGAYEYPAGGAQNPTPPTGLTAVVQ